MVELTSGEFEEGFFDVVDIYLSFKTLRSLAGAIRQPRVAWTTRDSSFRVMSVDGSHEVTFTNRETGFWVTERVGQSAWHELRRALAEWRVPPAVGEESLPTMREFHAEAKKALGKANDRLKTDPYVRLSRSYALARNGRVLAVSGLVHDGASCVCFPTEAAARAYLGEARGPASSDGEYEPLAVDDVWAFMRQVAGQGLCAIVSDANGSQSPTFVFTIRTEEAGNNFPTVLSLPASSEESWDCMTRSGRRRVDPSSLIPWSRHDILDPVLAELSGEGPLGPNWSSGDPLFELRTAAHFLLIGHVPLLGDWNSFVGSLAFFTSEESAEEYRGNLCKAGSCRIMQEESGEFDPGAGPDLLSLHEVRDLGARLSDLARVAPLACWSINPGGGREASGYGRNWVDQRQMSCVSGRWEMRAHNQFIRLGSFQGWMGMDTIGWSGGQALQLTGLDRTLSAAVLGESVSLQDDLSVSEIDEVLKDWLDPSQPGPWFEEERSPRPEDWLDYFYLATWDSVTGETRPFVWLPTFYHALRFLSQSEETFDREWRTLGVPSCHALVGFQGSDDAAAEKLRGERFRLGLYRLGQRFLLRGYVPSDADDLASLCNAVLLTTHVDGAGYAKDILWRSAGPQVDDILERFEIPREVWDEWQLSEEAWVDARGSLIAKARMEADVWQLLAPRTRHFLSTALAHLDDQGHAPQLDYAPISLEVVKALEYELGLILAEFRTSVAGVALTHDPEKREEVALQRYLGGGTAPELGTMSYLLREEEAAASELRLALRTFLRGMPNFAFLSGNDFAKKGLTRVTKKYRNRGVHDSRIVENVCLECVEALVGSATSPGFIPQVAQWKATRTNRDS